MQTINFDSPTIIEYTDDQLAWQICEMKKTTSRYLKQIKKVEAKLFYGTKYATL